MQRAPGNVEKLWFYRVLVYFFKNLSLFKSYMTILKEREVIGGFRIKLKPTVVKSVEKGKN